MNDIARTRTRTRTVVYLGAGGEIDVEREDGHWGAAVREDGDDNLAGAGHANAVVAEGGLGRRRRVELGLHLQVRVLLRQIGQDVFGAAVKERHHRTRTHKHAHTHTHAHAAKRIRDQLLVLSRMGAHLGRSLSWRMWVILPDSLKTNEAESGTKSLSMICIISPLTSSGIGCAANGAS